MHNPIISLSNISYKLPKSSSVLIDEFNLSVMPGDIVAILGPSGVGKTSLLQIIGGLLSPLCGTIVVNNEVLYNGVKIDEWVRAKNFAYVFQDHHLLSELNGFENIAMPLWISGVGKAEIQDRVKDTLVAIGILDKAYCPIDMLSGGEKQRLAIARALVMKKKIVIADEPTGNLDRRNADNVFELLRQLCELQNTSCIIATHDIAIANLSDKVINL